MVSVIQEGGSFFNLDIYVRTQTKGFMYITVVVNAGPEFCFVGRRVSPGNTNLCLLDYPQVNRCVK